MNWRTALIGLLLAATLILAAQNRATRAEGDKARAELTRALAALELAAEAAEVHRAHIKRQDAEAADWRALAEELTNQEGSDAPLSDYARGAAGRVLAR